VVKSAFVKPGVITRWHRVREPSCRQRITNIGKEDLVFLAICSPGFTNDAYEETE